MEQRATRCTYPVNVHSSCRRIRLQLNKYACRAISKEGGARKRDDDMQGFQNNLPSQPPAEQSRAQGLSRNGETDCELRRNVKTLKA
jgi:hypothetical protein